MQWSSFKYQNADRIALILGDDKRGNECQLAYQVSKGGSQDESNNGFRSFKDELIIGREDHPAMWHLIPAEVREEIEKIAAAAEADKPSMIEKFIVWLKAFKKVVK